MPSINLSTAAWGTSKGNSPSASGPGALALVCLVLPLSGFGMPMDSLLHVPSPTASPWESRRLTIEAGYDIVPDNTAYVGPVRDDPEPEPAAIPRYQGSHVLARLRLSEHISLDGGYWSRAIANKRDRNDIESIQFALQFNVPGMWLGNRFAVRLGLWNNRAEAFTKSSYTNVADYRINSLAVLEPYDEQTQLSLITSRDLAKTLSVTGYTSVGLSSVSYDRIEGSFRDADDCAFRFNLAKDHGVVKQAQRCGSVITSQVSMPTETSIVNNIGINPRESLEYTAVFYAVGANAALRGDRWRATVGYEFREFKRNGVDDRVVEAGKTPQEVNHTFTTDVTYRLTEGVSLYGRAEYMTSRLLSIVPFTYNPFTAERFSEPGLFFNFGVRVGF